MKSFLHGVRSALVFGAMYAPAALASDAARNVVTRHPGLAIYVPLALVAVETLRKRLGSRSA